MLRRVVKVALRDLGVVRRLRVVTVLQESRGFPVMQGRTLVMFRSLLMVNRLVSHSNLLWLAFILGPGREDDRYAR